MFMPAHDAVLHLMRRLAITGTKESRPTTALIAHLMRVAATTTRWAAKSAASGSSANAREAGPRHRDVVVPN